MALESLKDSSTSTGQDNPKQPLPPIGHKSKGRWIRYFSAILALAVLCGAVYVLHHELSEMSFDAVLSHMREVPVIKLMMALLFTFLSYLVLTNYDRIALEYIQRTLLFRRVAPISFMAFAVGHNIGFAAVSGGSIRYRAYSAAGLSSVDIAKIIGFCSLTFALGGTLLLGTTLIVEPSHALARIGLPADLLKIIGLLLLMVLVTYLGWSRRPDRQIQVRSWRIKVPGIRIGIKQVITAALDLSLSSAVLFILLPANAGVSYPEFLGVYVIAIGLGLVSTVPGGLGVFEGVLLLLLPQISAPQLLGAALLYRICYYLIPLAVALILMAFFELRAYRSGVSKALVSSTQWVGRLVPLGLSLAVFLAGAVLVLSGSLPVVTSRLSVVAEWIPLPLLEASHLLSSALGVCLLIVAYGLNQRLRGAYFLALILLCGGILLSLLKGLNYEEAGVLAFAAVLLWIARKEFYRPARLLDQRISRGWLISTVLVIAAGIWLGLLVYSNVSYRDELWWEFALNADAPRMLRAALVTVIVAGTIGLLYLLRSAPPAPAAVTTDEQSKIRQVIAKSGEAMSNVALLGDKRFLLHPSGEAFIMYQVSGRSWIALGDPVGAAEHHSALAWQFRELSDRYGAYCAFYQVGRENLSLYVDLGLSMSKLGEEARVDLTQFSLEGPGRADLRQARNRAGRDGASFEVIAAVDVPSIIGELKQISDTWLAAKKASEKGFSLGSFKPEYLQNFDIAVIRLNGKIVAFANLWSSGDKQELSVDLMRHVDTPLKTVMDYLFVESMLWGKAQGYHYFSLGMAPLSGLEQHALASLWHKIGNVIFRFGDEFYNFAGLRQYKSKFDPEWEPLYLAAPGGLALPRVLIDATVIISGGLKGVFAK